LPVSKSKALPIELAERSIQSLASALIYKEQVQVDQSIKTNPLTNQIWIFDTTLGNSKYHFYAIKILKYAEV
jgi:hypothetical protein